MDIQCEVATECFKRPTMALANVTFFLFGSTLVVIIVAKKPT